MHLSVYQWSAHRSKSRLLSILRIGFPLHTSSWAKLDNLDFRQIVRDPSFKTLCSPSWTKKPARSPWNLPLQLQLCRKYRNDQLRVDEIDWKIKWFYIKGFLPSLPGGHASVVDNWKVDLDSSAPSQPHNLLTRGFKNSICFGSSPLSLFHRKHSQCKWKMQLNSEKQGWVLRVLAWKTNLT